MPEMKLDNGLYITDNTPESSAIIQADSNSQGLLPPRMTSANRDSIASPATGLVIFNTDTQQLEVFDGTAWSGAGSSNVDERISYIYLAVGGTNSFNTSPMPLNSQQDLAGNLRAPVASNQFFPVAGRYEISGSFYQNNRPVNQNTVGELYLYNTNTAVRLTDVYGNDVTTYPKYFSSDSEYVVPLDPHIVDFDGTEVLELRATQLALYYSVSAYARPIVIRIRQV